MIGTDQIRPSIPYSQQVVTKTDPLRKGDINDSKVNNLPESTAQL
jgi:hypothetical protein